MKYCIIPKFWNSLGTIRYYILSDIFYYTARYIYIYICIFWELEVDNYIAWVIFPAFLYWAVLETVARVTSKKDKTKEEKHVTLLCQIFFSYMALVFSISSRSLVVILVISPRMLGSWMCRFQEISRGLKIRWGKQILVTLGWLCFFWVRGLSEMWHQQRFMLWMPCSFRLLLSFWNWCKKWIIVLGVWYCFLVLGFTYIFSILFQRNVVTLDWDSRLAK